MRRWLHADWSLAALPAALWVLGCALWMFRVGRSAMDIASAHEPGTDAWSAGPALSAASIGYEWLAHLVVYLLHALCAWLAFRAARALGLSARVSVLASVLMLVYPFHGHTVHGIATAGAIAGASCALGALWGAARSVRDGRSVVPIVVACACAAAAPWVDAQAGAALLALPMVGLALGARAALVWRRLAWPTIVAWASVGWSVALHLDGSPPELSAADEFERAVVFVIAAAQVHSWDDELSGAFEMLRGATATQGLQIASGLALAVIAGGRWLPAFSRAKERRVRARLGVGLVLFGAAAVLASWLPPLLLTREAFVHRHLYAGGSLAAIGLAAAAGACLRCAPRLVIVRWFGGGVVFVVGVVGALLQAGYAEAYAQRSTSDRRAVRVLRDAVPSPAPGAVFVPVEAGADHAGTGAVLFDRVFPSVWSVPGAAAGALRDAYRRDDVGSQSVLVVTDVDDVVPVSFDDDGDVTVWPGLAIVSASGVRTRAAFTAHGDGALLASRDYAVPSGDWWRAASRWRRSDGSTALMNTRVDDGIELPSVWLHPAFAAVPDQFSATLDVSAGDRLIVRAALADAARTGDGVALRVFAGGVPVGGVVRLDPVVVGDGWITRVFSLPEGTDHVRVVVDPGGSGDLSYDGVWVHAVVGRSTRRR